MVPHQELSNGSPLERDREAFDLILDRVTRAAQAHLAAIDEAAVIPETAAPGLTGLPADPLGGSGALDVFMESWLPGMVASAGPRFLGYVTGGATPAAVAGDWWVSALDQNVASDEGVAAHMERQVVAWLRELLGLPSGQHGAMVTGGTTANFTCLAVARQWAGERRGVAVDEHGVGELPRLRVYAGTPHASIGKCLSMLGLGRHALELVPVLQDREAMDPDALEAQLRNAEGPTVVVANVGTVNSGDIDDLRAVLALRERYEFWLHIDGAFGAFAALDERVAGRVAGIGLADSVAVDLHKWMNVPYDSAVAFTRRPDLQAQVFRNQGSYLSAVEDEPEFLHLVPENSRRFRALPVWFSLVAYGQSGIARIVRRCNDHADQLASRLGRIPGVTVLAPTHLNIVCFATPIPPAEVVAAVIRSGEAFLTTTVYQGRPAVRAAFSNWRTTEADVDRIAVAIENFVVAVGT